MFKLLILSSLMLLSSNVFADGNTGGMDGGGGGTLPSHPATVQQIEALARNARPQLLALLNGYEISEKSRQQIPLYQKLFGGSQKAQEVLNNLQLEVRIDKPCFTANGVEVDGSIYAQKSNTICLSAFRIASKLDIAAVEREVSALLLHELSHFMGADETEAIALQQNIAKSFLDFPDRKINIDNLNNELGYFSGNLQSAIYIIKNKGDLESADKNLTQAFTWLDKFRLSSGFLPFHFFGAREDDYQQLLELKLKWAESYLLTQIPGPNQQQAQLIYDSSFKGRDYFIAGEQWVLQSQYSNEKIFKIHSIAELTSLLEDLYSQYHVRWTHITQVKNGYAWLKLDGHLTIPSQNPWENFLGEYEIQSVQCTGLYESPYEVKYSVLKKSEGVILQVKDREGRIGLLIGFADSSWAGTLVNYGPTPDGGVFMLHYSGGGWTADGKITDFRLKRLPGGLFEISKTVNKSPLAMDKPDEVGTCVYTGSIK